MGRAAQPTRRSRHVHEDQDDHGPAREKILRGPDNRELPPDEASGTELTGDVRAGRVVSIRGTEIGVEPGEGGDPVGVVLRKSTRIPHPGASAAVVGDQVLYLVDGPPPHVLTEVRPRRTRLTRIRRGHEEHVVCANVDLGVIIATAADPPFKPRLVDRYLISFAQGGMEPVLVLNKIDLLEDGGAGPLLEPYAALDFPALAVSAATGEGLEALRAVLVGRTAVFVGQSGVGKSSLLNRLGGLELRTQEVQGWTGKGRHTTSTSTLYAFPFGGSIIDTPGIRSFQVHRPTVEALEAFFPEVFEVAAGCRFRDCTHSGDEGCAVPEALADGRIRPDRLESFRILMEEVRSR